VVFPSLQHLLQRESSHTWSLCETIYTGINKIKVPSGNSLRVHYPEGREPHLEVRLQEVFGWSQTPKLLGGAKNLTLHLLGPNYRPVQVTADLSSFWKNAYPEVRKELRAKYPKHSWPEDPLTAPAVAKGRPQKY
jgi:ATP-dependent helicase HrpB